MEGPQKIVGKWGPYLMTLIEEEDRPEAKQEKYYVQPYEWDVQIIGNVFSVQLKAEGREVVNIDLSMAPEEVWLRVLYNEKKRGGWTITVHDGGLNWSMDPDFTLPKQ
jgi:hypothetical protein